LLWLAHAFASIAVPLTIYSLKPRLQALLCPAAAYLHAGGITANQVTVAACLVCVGPALLLAWGPPTRCCSCCFPFGCSCAWRSTRSTACRPRASQALLFPALTVLIALTIVNRVRGALRELPA